MDQLPTVTMPPVTVPPVTALSGSAVALHSDPGQERPTVYTRAEAYCGHCRVNTDQVLAWLGYEVGQDTFCLDCGYSLIDDELVSCEVNATCDQWTDVLDACVPVSMYDAIVEAGEFLAVATRSRIELAVADAQDNLDAAYERAACFLAHPARRRLADAGRLTAARAA